MKKILFFIMMFFWVININAQISTETAQLQKDINTLKNSNSKLKNQLNELVAQQTQTLNEMKGMVSSTDQKVNINENTLNITNTSISGLENYTTNKFMKYKMIIKIILVIGGLSFILVFILMFLLLRNLKEKISYSNNELQSQFAQQHDIFISQLNITNEAVEKRVNDISKKHSDEIIEMKTAINKSILQLTELTNNNFDAQRSDTEDKIKILNSSFDQIIIEIKQDIQNIKSELKKSKEHLDKHSH